MGGSARGAQAPRRGGRAHAMTTKRAPTAAELRTCRHEARHVEARVAATAMTREHAE